MSRLFPEKPTLYGTEQPIDDPTWLNLTSAEREANAKYILWYLMDKGMSYAAVVGMIGNMMEESYICPSNREKNWDPDTQAERPFLTGLGLIQWTPYTRVEEFLTNWGERFENLASNMRGQCRQLWYEQDAEQSGADYVWHLPVYYPQGYFQTKKDFYTTDDFEKAAGTYVIMRERPATMTESGSLQEAQATVSRRILMAQTVNMWMRKYLNADGTLNYSYAGMPYWFLFKMTERRR